MVNNNFDTSHHSSNNISNKDFNNTNNDHNVINNSKDNNILSSKNKINSTTSRNKHKTYKPKVNFNWNNDRNSNNNT